MTVTGFSAEVRSTTFAKAYNIELHTSRTLFTKTNGEIRVKKNLSRQYQIHCIDV